MENTSTQLASTGVVQLNVQTKQAEEHHSDTRLADASSHAIRAGRLLRWKPSTLSGDEHSNDFHDIVSPISNPYTKPFVLEDVDSEGTDGIHASTYDMLLSDIIRGYEYCPNLATEFSWATDAQLRLTPMQLSLLEMYFEEQPKPSIATKREIAEIAGISFEKVTYWFQNRRAKERLRARGQKENCPSDLHYALKAEQFLETEEYRSGLVGYYDPERLADDCPSLSSGSTVSSRNPSARSTDYCPSLSSGSTVSSRNPSARSSPGDISLVEITSETLDLSSFGEWSFLEDSETKQYADATPAYARRFKVLRSHLLDRPEKCPLTSCEFHVRGFARRFDKHRHMRTHFQGTLYCGFCSVTTPFNDCDMLLRHLVSVHGAHLDRDVEENDFDEESREDRESKKPTDSPQQKTADYLIAECSVCSTAFNPRGMWEHLKSCVIEKVIKDSEAMQALHDAKTKAGFGASDCSTLALAEKSEVAPPSSVGETRFDHADEENVIPDKPTKNMAIPNSPTTSAEIHTSDEETDWTEDVASSSPPSEDEISEVRPVLSPVKQQIVNHLMREFNRQFNSNFGIRTQNGGNSTQRTGTRTPSPLARSGAIVGSRKRKGSRGNSPPPPNDGNGEDPNKRRRPDAKLDDAESVMLRFACPYYKRNPRRHQTFTSCRDPGFTTVSRLKEHLYRRHLLPIQCNRCCSIFENESQLREHQRDPRGCEIQEQMPLEGFDKAQERKLKSKKRSLGSQTEEDKWKSVYRILFPDDADDDMPSPYCEYITRSKSPDSDKSRNVARFQEFSRLELPRLVRRTLEVAVEKEAQPLEERLKDQLVDIVRECQSQLISMFQAAAQPLPTELPTGQPDNGTANQANMTDPIVEPELPNISTSLPTWDLPLLSHNHNHSTLHPLTPLPPYDSFTSMPTPEKPSPPAMDIPGIDSPESLSSLDIPEAASLSNQAFPENEYLDLGKYEGLATTEESSSFGFEGWPAEWGFEDPLMMYGGHDGVS
jgi:hypothetical protein